MTSSRIRVVSAVPLVLGVAGLLASAAAAATPGAGPVYVLPTTGVVDGVMAGYLEESLRRAERDGSPAVIVQLNTPGGSLDATQRIVSAFLESPVPVIVWVSPAGGRAASAGTFITLAANLAYMAPGTNIGAASPVGAGGEDIPGTLGDKVRNDAIANITAIAEARERPVEWAVATVRDAKSSQASEAVSVGAVDGIAGSLAEVFAAADGRTVRVGGSDVTLRLAGVESRELAMNPFQGLLHLLADPNISFILFTIGFYGLLFELQNPNFVTGILGALAIILAFVGFGSLPLNLAGLLLIALAIVLFVLELTVTSHGLLTIGGLVSFVLGASALYTEPGDPLAPAVEVAVPLVALMTTLTASFMAVIVIVAIRTRRLATAPGLVGAAVPVGETAVVRRPIEPLGSVFFAGEEWTARSADDAPIRRGEQVTVVNQDGLTLVVERDHRTAENVPPAAR